MLKCSFEYSEDRPPDKNPCRFFKGHGNRAGVTRFTVYRRTERDGAFSMPRRHAVPNPTSTPAGACGLAVNDTAAAVILCGRVYGRGRR
jgi:hypothetical protein